MYGEISEGELGMAGVTLSSLSKVTADTETVCRCTRVVYIKWETGHIK